MNRAVFLDRDGVINRAIVRNGKPYPPKDILDLEILPGVKEALMNLRKAGYLLVVITNQPDVARGITKRETVEEINRFLSCSLPLDGFKTCYHDSADLCMCRKPQPGALLSAANEYSIDLAKSYMIGDRWRDIDAGARAGCKTCFIEYGYAEKQPEHVDIRAANLPEVAKIILGERC